MLIFNEIEKDTKIIQLNNKIDTKLDSSKFAMIGSKYMNAIYFPSGDIIISGLTPPTKYSLTQQYGGMYFTQFILEIPDNITINGVRDVIITPLANIGLMSVSITNIVGKQIHGYIFNPVEGDFNIRLNILINCH